MEQISSAVEGCGIDTVQRGHAGWPGAVRRIYTFYLRSGGGPVSRFEAFELGGDEFAPARALRMHSEHPACAYLTVTSLSPNRMPEFREVAAVQVLEQATVLPAPADPSLQNRPGRGAQTV